jgi:hypothetical protein
MKDTTYHTFRTMGLIGLAIQLTLNLVVLLVFKRTSEFFTEPWFSDWFPGYAVWLVFAIIGICGTWRGTNGSGRG